MKIDMSVWFNTTLDFTCESDGEMVHGSYVPGEAETYSVLGDLQPNQREQTYAEYGFITDAEYKFFCEDFTPEIGDHTTYHDAVYVVDKSVDWDDYRILYLKAVQNG